MTVIFMNKLFFLSLIFFLISGLFVTVFSSVSTAAELVEDSWNSKASMQQARGGLGVVALDGKIYAIGGKTVNGFVGTNEQYDPKTDTWVTLEPMPTSRAYFAIAAYQGKIYCVGGLNTAGSCSVNEVYDTVTGSWSTKASLPFKGEHLQGHVVDGKLFVIDGYSLFLYDSIEDSWTRKDSPKTLASNAISSAVVDDEIVIIDSLGVMFYDFNSDTWRKGSKPSSELDSCLSGVTTGIYAPKKIYAMGIITTKSEWWDAKQLGQVKPVYVTSISSTVKVYDPVKDVWSNAKVYGNRIDFGIAVLDDILYVIGGCSIIVKDTMVNVDVEEIDPVNPPFGTKIVSKQFSVPETVIGEPTALNVQYVPIGYQVTSTGNVVSPSNQIDDSVWLGFSSIIVILVVLVLIVGVVIIGLFIYIRKRMYLKREK